MATSRSTQAPSESTTGNPGAVTQMAAEESHLLALPVELQKTILEYVRTSVPSFNLGLCQLTTGQLTTNRDKKSACLTCKQMQLLATPLLYRHMEIGHHCLNDPFEANMSKEHPGLKHVRSLRITTRSHRPHVGERKGSRAICRLLVNIPKHALTQLEYGNHVILPRAHRN
jgi:hypothetical protein